MMLRVAAFLLSLGAVASEQEISTDCFVLTGDGTEIAPVPGVFYGNSAATAGGIVLTGDGTEVAPEAGRFCPYIPELRCSEPTSGATGTQGCTDIMVFTDSESVCDDWTPGSTVARSLSVPTHGVCEPFAIPKGDESSIIPGMLACDENGQIFGVFGCDANCENCEDYWAAGWLSGQVILSLEFPSQKCLVASFHLCSHPISSNLC
jgi:hypothetical protein